MALAVDEEVDLNFRLCTARADDHDVFALGLIIKHVGYRETGICYFAGQQVCDLFCEIVAHFDDPTSGKLRRRGAVTCVNEDSKR